MVIFFHNYRTVQELYRTPPQGTQHNTNNIITV